MSEVKRVTLTTISDVVKKSPFGGSGVDQNTENIFSGAFAGSSGTAANSSNLKNGSASSKDRKTVRLELELFEPTTNSFPEFNYSKLVREEQKRQRKIEKKATPNGFLSDPENDDDVMRIARELERKYGAGTAYSSAGKFSRPSQLDYCDKGAGYDEEDSFIDNTEAYDELIPQEVETVGGGFYINSGQLEFKTLSNFERPEDAIRMPKPKKRLLSTSSESSEAEDVAKKAKKKDDAGSGASGAESAGKSSKTGQKRLNGHVSKKQKACEEKKISKEEPQVVKDSKKKKEIKEPSVPPTTGGKEIKVVKTTTVKDMLRAKRDSLRKMEQEKKGRSSGSASSSEAEEDGDGDEDDEDDDEEDDGSDASGTESSGSGSDESDTESGTGSDQGAKINGEQEAKKRIEIKLPDNLPDHLLQDMDSLKEIAQNASGKLNFFDAKVANLLLQIDVSSRMCSGNARNIIYKHLEHHLHVSRQTLMVKIKKIRIRKEENKVKKAVTKLEDVVTDMMPRVITNHELERREATELRTASGENGDKADIKYPKKKFPWNEKVRNLLYDIATIRKQSFHILRPRKETEEEFINNYLKKYVVPLWPAGWMKFEDLQKELDRRKKAPPAKSVPKEVKKTVQLTGTPTVISTVPTSAPVMDAITRTETVLSATVKHPSVHKNEEKNVIRPPQSSPVPVASPSQPPASTSPATAKRTSDHSIINIISSPPSKSSSHSTPPFTSQPPRPQSQPLRPLAGFDEDLIQAHVINLESHSVIKRASPVTSSPATLDLRITSPALSSASSASSSRRASMYQETPPMAHSNSTSAASTTTRKGRKSRDDDSDSSIEIIGEYVAEKNPLNLALPPGNKDRSKKAVNAAKVNKHAGGSTTVVSSSGLTINNNLDNARYSSAATTVGGFALPSMAGLIQEIKSNSTVPSRMGPAPNELDVIRIMKELQELQSIQLINKNTMQNDAHSSTHASTSSKKMDPANRHLQPTSNSQQQQQSHHTISNGPTSKKLDTAAKRLGINSVAANLKKTGQH